MEAKGTVASRGRAARTQYQVHSHKRVLNAKDLKRKPALKTHDPDDEEAVISHAELALARALAAIPTRRPPPAAGNCTPPPEVPRLELKKSAAGQATKLNDKGGRHAAALIYADGGGPGACGGAAPASATPPPFAVSRNFSEDRPDPPAWNVRKQRPSPAAPLREKKKKTPPPPPPQHLLRERRMDDLRSAAARSGGGQDQPIAGKPPVQDESFGARPSSARRMVT